MESKLKTAQAGTVESNDAVVTIVPAEKGSGIEIAIQSSVMIQFGEAIKNLIEQTVAAQGITDVHVNIVDRGALDCTIKARVLTALLRAGFELQEGIC